jgi:hypothetical protein
MNKDIEKIIKKEGFDGFVEKPILGKDSKITGFVKGNKIYGIEERDKIIGHVKYNRAYSSIIGIAQRDLGKVKCKSQEKEPLF